MKAVKPWHYVSRIRVIVKKATSSEIQFKVTLWSQRKKGKFRDHKVLILVYLCLPNVERIYFD